MFPVSESVAQLIARNAQQCGGMYLIASAAFKRLLYKTALDSSQESRQVDAIQGEVHLFAKFAQALATALCGHAYSIGQILHTNLAPIAQDLSALDRAAQL